jgi:hypothetical protein
MQASQVLTQRIDLSSAVKRFAEGGKSALAQLLEWVRQIVAAIMRMFGVAGDVQNEAAATDPRQPTAPGTSEPLQVSFTGRSADVERAVGRFSGLVDAVMREPAPIMADLNDLVSRQLADQRIVSVVEKMEALRFTHDQLSDSVGQLAEKLAKSSEFAGASVATLVGMLKNDAAHATNDGSLKSRLQLCMLSMDMAARRYGELEIELQAVSAKFVGESGRAEFQELVGQAFTQAMTYYDSRRAGFDTVGGLLTPLPSAPELIKNDVAFSAPPSTPAAVDRVMEAFSPPSQADAGALEVATSLPTTVDNVIQGDFSRTPEPVPETTTAMPAPSEAPAPKSLLSQPAAQASIAAMAHAPAATGSMFKKAAPVAVVIPDQSDCAPDEDAPGM